MEHFQTQYSWPSGSPPPAAIPVSVHESVIIDPPTDTDILRHILSLERHKTSGSAGVFTASFKEGEMEPVRASRLVLEVLVIRGSLVLVGGVDRFPHI